MMHGRIWAVANSHGISDSTTLLLRFQLHPSGIISEPGRSSDHLQQPFSSLFKGLKVLLADDDDIRRAINVKLLQKLGCLVSSVSSGSQCLSFLGTSNTRFDLIVLDVEMHNTDGFDLAMRIQKFRSGNWPLILALAASTQENIWEKCLQSGMHGLIQKPITLQGMAQELRRVLRNT